ncbi:MAG TPA: hypothetical protein VLR90_11770 [Blastocatellia bacterium]|nr:hypothetical protein [Blastocatellia bacterium]
MKKLPHSLDFSHRHLYPSEKGITIPITLTSDISLSASLFPSLDTGSTYCVFERIYAQVLGLNLTSGIEEVISTATGLFYYYGHELTLSVFGLEWQAIVYFAEPEAFSLNVIGRVGFLDRLRVGIVNYEQLVYLGLYE